MQIDKAFAFHNGGDQVLFFNSDTISGSNYTNRSSADIRLNNTLHALTFGVSDAVGQATHRDLLVLKEGGNVGIGTTSPSQKLQVGTNGDGTSAVANA